MSDPTDIVMSPSAAPVPPEKKVPINLATISSGFEKGDFLVREEKGQRVYFDFFEEAFNYVSFWNIFPLPLFASILPSQLLMMCTNIVWIFLPRIESQVANKGYTKLSGDEEDDWLKTFSEAHNSVKGGMRYNTGKLLMVLTKPVDIAAVYSDEKGSDNKFVSNKDENTLV